MANRLWALKTIQDRELAIYLNGLSEAGQDVHSVFPSTKVMGSFDVLSYEEEPPVLGAVEPQPDKKKAPTKKAHVKNAPASPAIPKSTDAPQA